MDEMSQKMIDDPEFQEILKDKFKANGLDYELFDENEKLRKTKRSWLQNMVFGGFNMMGMISILKMSTPSVQHEDDLGRDNRVYRNRSYLGGILGLIAFVPIPLLILN